MQTIAYLKLIQHASKNDYNHQKANAAYEEIRKWFVFYCPQCPINEIPSYWELYSLVDEIRKLRPALRDEMFDSCVTPQKMWVQIDTETSGVSALEHNPTYLDTFFLQLRSGDIPMPNTIDQFWYNASIASERDKQRLLGWFWKYCPQCEPEDEPPLRLLIFHIHKAKSLLGAKAKPEVEMEDSIPIFQRFSMFIKQGRIPLSTLPFWYYPRPIKAKDLTWQQAAELLVWCQKYTPNLSLTETPLCPKDLGEVIASGIEHVISALERIKQRLTTALEESTEIPIISDNKNNQEKSEDNTTYIKAKSTPKDWHHEWTEKIPFIDLKNIQIEKGFYSTGDKYPKTIFNLRLTTRKSHTKKRKPKSLATYTTEDTCHSKACTWADVDEVWKRIQSEQSSYYDGIEHPKFCFDDTEVKKVNTEWNEISWYGVVDYPSFDMRFRNVEEVLDFERGMVVIDEFAW
ncbi:dd915b83-ad26-4670-b008-3b8dcbde697b [Sclerotinia trifoliorum]|uniref:Dd915b83-ad26-4670-b008-3b8dcbde697b n=1 Tax=Sclerotinia trifoliorum TaxID=28548 RepID=A0A8H2ZMS8_9HELO|nr:dd915b83-ad26-4670-b008-3b8dcbde697b [Sclerotinia trifoliorum]